MIFLVLELDSADGRGQVGEEGRAALLQRARRGRIQQVRHGSCIQRSVKIRCAHVIEKIRDMEY